MIKVIIFKTMDFFQWVFYILLSTWCLKGKILTKIRSQQYHDSSFSLKLRNFFGHKRNQKDTQTITGAACGPVW